MELRLYYCSLRHAVRVRLQLKHIRLQKHHFKQRVEIHLRLCGHGYAYRIAAPFLGHKAVLRELLHYAVGICSLPVHLVYRDNYWHVRRLSVVYRLNRLRHYSIIRRDDEYYNIRDLRAARPHRRKRLMARRVYERYQPAVACHLIRAYMLGYAPCFARRYARMAYRVKKRRLSVVDVTHYRDDRRTLDKARFLISVVGLLLKHILKRLLRLIFKLDIVVGRNKRACIEIDLLVYRSHYAHVEQFFDYLGNRFADLLR